MKNHTRYRRLSERECQKLHWASLEILERTGARLHHQPAIDLLKKAGASVSDGNRVRIPSTLVENALNTAPSEITLYNRHGEPVIPIEGFRSFFGTGSDCLHILDHRTGERRQPLLQDVVEGMTLCDALPNIDFVMGMFLPEDVPRMTADRYVMETMLHFTTKPIIFVTTDLAGCVDAVEMAEVVVGGPQALQQKPLTACYINVTSGLQHNEEALQKILYLSGKGLPSTYIPVALGGATAPITLAGNMAIWNAGCLVGLVLSQLNRPGAPFITSGWGASALDMRTTVSPYVEPEKQFIAQELAHFYDLPMFAFGGFSDSKLADQQASLEAALTLMTNVLSGSHLVHDLGYLESGLTGSLVQLAICNELISWIKEALRPVEINDETLALDVIDKVGPDGHFLDNEHTLAHFRDRWYPTLIDHNNYEGWIAKGGQDLGQRAAARVTHILAEHTPEPLSPDIQKRLREIVQRAAVQ
ncbi:trimethylamine methyltransferase [Candidatus Vecturithrix granuli]|uniref:Trimethylamine methyltransferase n=1 Tax=Vecturithrix granuli TaxID=1499967 RepID=A0A081C4W9_VECG1|nr:trimethylamine methyltransferase [Candidatus Vecturithrix granuli]